LRNEFHSLPVEFVEARPISDPDLKREFPNGRCLSSAPIESRAARCEPPGYPKSREFAAEP
jgi:hypothetical protein